MRICLLLLLAALGSCQRPASSEAPKVEQAREPGGGTPDEALNGSEISSLAGEWRVAGIDGRSFDEPVGLALRANDQEIWWEPRCAGMVRRYRIEGRNISFGSAGPPRRKGAPTPPVCAIGLPPRLGEVFAALDAATTVFRTPSNGVAIEGREHSLILFSQ